MYRSISLKRGLDLRLRGGIAPGAETAAVKPDRVAMVPDDFPGFTPRVAVKAGDHVDAGQALMTDKVNPAITVVSPVSGTVEDIVRGERRKVLRIVVKADEGAPCEAHPGKPASTPEAVRESLMTAGLWVMMRQLPYDIAPDAQAVPRDIFVTAFDSAPLASPLMDRVEGKEAAVKAGLRVLASLTKGKVYVSVSDEAAAAKLDCEADNIETVIVAGHHPAGLASIQADNIAPVNKGETVWMLDIETAARIGSLVTDGTCSWATTVAITGSDVTTPHETVTVTGAEIAPLIKGQLSADAHHKRIIAGNVLTGFKESAEGFLRYPYRQLTVIPEGDDVDEFMGWASLSTKKMSESRSFLSRLFPRRLFAPDARINGGRRAMIMSGLYEKTLPMDIMPEHLIKAILSRDIDRMEALGIYEVTPADFALCEYVDPSKLELQKIVREGLDYLRKELS